MPIARRPLRLGELDYELIWLTVSLTSLAVAAAWLASGLPWPHCVFLSLTGHPCITCGATRSAIAFFHGNFLSALRWNPLVFAALCGLSVFNAYAFAVLIMRTPRLRLTDLTRGEKEFVRFGAISLLVMNWVYLLAYWRNF
jgi:hypothetical protein